MKFLNFFKKLRKAGKQQEHGPEKEKVPLPGLESWTDSRQTELKQREKEIMSLVKERVEVFEEEVAGKIKALEGVDVNEKKADERLKSHSEEGRKKFVYFVESLVLDMKKLVTEGQEGDEGIHKFISKTDKAFLDFNKTAGKSYERATILIGKEARLLKDSIKKFSDEVSMIFKNNKGVINNLKALSGIKVRLSQLKEVGEEIERLEKEISLTSEEIENKSEENKQILKEIDEIKKSREYLEQAEKQKNLRLLTEETEKEVFRLRQLIDFKALGNFYHLFPDKMQIVKSHRENFRESFNKNDGKSILSLLEGAKLENNQISNKIEVIRNKKEEAKSMELEINKDKTQDKISSLHSRLASATMESGNLRNKKSIQEGKLEKLKVNKGQIIRKIREDAMKVGAEVN